MCDAHSCFSGRIGRRCHRRRSAWHPRPPRSGGCGGRACCRERACIRVRTSRRIWYRVVQRLERLAQRHVYARARAIPCLRGYRRGTRTCKGVLLWIFGSCEQIAWHDRAHRQPPCRPKALDGVSWCFCSVMHLGGDSACEAHAGISTSSTCRHGCGVRVREREKAVSARAFIPMARPVRLRGRPQRLRSRSLPSSTASPRLDARAHGAAPIGTPCRANRGASAGPPSIEGPEARGPHTHCVCVPGLTPPHTRSTHTPRHRRAPTPSRPLCSAQPGSAGQHRPTATALSAPFVGALLTRARHSAWPQPGPSTHHVPGPPHRASNHMPGHQARTRMPSRGAPAPPQPNTRLVGAPPGSPY